METIEACCGDSGMAFYLGDKATIVKCPRSDSTKAQQAYATKIIKLLNAYKAQGVIEVKEQFKGTLSIDSYIASWQGNHDEA